MERDVKAERVDRILNDAALQLVLHVNRINEGVPGLNSSVFSMLEPQRQDETDWRRDNLYYTAQKVWSLYRNVELLATYVDAALGRLDKIDSEYEE